MQTFCSPKLPVKQGLRLRALASAAEFTANIKNLRSAWEMETGKKTKAPCALFS
jgi:ribosomal protein L15E